MFAIEQRSFEDGGSAEEGDRTSEEAYLKSLNWIYFITHFGSDAPKEVLANLKKDSEKRKSSPGAVVRAGDSDDEGEEADTYEQIITSIQKEFRVRILLFLCSWGIPDKWVLY